MASFGISQALNLEALRFSGKTILVPSQILVSSLFLVSSPILAANLILVANQILSMTEVPVDNLAP
ncbi:MAG: hypothetical protein C0508_24365 [Cyanobacteria bacterium PR.023]|nr:hypothetical protein [Cyanobacteria bacterium PR.023]